MGFTVTELLVATVVLPIFIIGFSQALNLLRDSYATSKQINDILSVISIDPELDRGIRYQNLTNTNVIKTTTVADEGGANRNYTSTLVIQDNTSVNESGITINTLPSLKVLDVSSNYRRGSTTEPMKFRLLIAPGGIGQQ